MSTSFTVPLDGQSKLRKVNQWIVIDPDDREHPAYDLSSCIPWHNQKYLSSYEDAEKAIRDDSYSPENNPSYNPADEWPHMPGYRLGFKLQGSGIVALRFPYVCDVCDITDNGANDENVKWQKTQQEYREHFKSYSFAAPNGDVYILARGYIPESFHLDDVRVLCTGTIPMDNIEELDKLPIEDRYTQLGSLYDHYLVAHKRIMEHNQSINLIDNIPSVFAYKDEDTGNDPVPGLIYSSAHTLITGDSGSGKSSLKALLCRSVADGKPFLGMPTHQRKCLYLDYENSRKMVKKRLTRLNIKDGGNFHYVTMRTFGKMPVPWCAEILTWIESCDVPPIIVIDSLRAVLDGDESSSKDIRKFFTLLDQLKTLGAAVIIIHHTGKGENTKEYRGSSDIKAAIDVGYVQTNDGGTRLGNITLTCFKAREEVVEQIACKYEEGSGIIPSCLQMQAEDIILKKLFDNDGMKKTELVDDVVKLHITRTVIREAIDKLIAKGLINVIPGSHNSQILKARQRESINAMVNNMFGKMPWAN